MAVEQVGNRNPDGLTFGVAATDLISFYGTAPVAQPSNAAQATYSGIITGAEILTHYTIAVAGSSVASKTVAAAALVVTGGDVSTTDYIIHSKITAQAGLGVAGFRPGTTALNVVADYVNMSSGAITPTTQALNLVSLRGVASTVTLTPAAVLSSTTVEQVFTVTPLPANSWVHVTKPTSQAGLGLAGFRAVANGKLGITFVNPTNATITPTAGESYSYIWFTTPVQPLSNISHLTITPDLSASVVGTAAVTEFAMPTLTGFLASGDFPSSAYPKTLVTNVGIVGVRLSTTDVIGLAYVNPTAAKITLSDQVAHTFTIVKQNAPALVTLYSVAITPTAVAANITGEQTFTVTGLAANSVVFVNKPSFTTGVGVVGSRTAAASSLGITFSNSTTAAITPPAETYQVAAFIPPAAIAPIGVGPVIHQQKFTPSSIAAFAQMAAVRNALVNVGLIAGS